MIQLPGNRATMWAGGPVHVVFGDCKHVLHAAGTYNRHSSCTQSWRTRHIAQLLQVCWDNVRRNVLSTSLMGPTISPDAALISRHFNAMNMLSTRWQLLHPAVCDTILHSTICRCEQLQGRLRLAIAPHGEVPELTRKVGHAEARKVEGRLNL